MTWSAVIKDKDGNPEGYEFACTKCRHSDGYPENCRIPNAAHPLASVLTSVDTDGKGHMAPGQAVLKCHGFEPKEDQ